MRAVIGKETGELKKLVGKLDGQVDSRIKGAGKSQTPLHKAAETGWEEGVQTLIDMGADVDAVDSKGCTPLFLAVKNKHPEVVHILLEKDANWQISNSDGLRPIDVASEDEEIAKILIQYVPQDSLPPKIRMLNPTKIEVILYYHPQTPNPMGQVQQAPPIRDRNPEQERKRNSSRERDQRDRPERGTFVYLFHLLFVLLIPLFYLVIFFSMRN